MRRIPSSKSFLFLSSVALFVCNTVFIHSEKTLSALSEMWDNFRIEKHNIEIFKNHINSRKFENYIIYYEKVFKVYQALKKVF